MSKPYNKQQSKGFTLLEILVVMLIVGAIATIGLRSYLASQMKARDTRRKNDIEQLARALELYRSDKGHYPVNNELGEMVAYWIDGAAAQQETVFEWGDSFIDPAQPTTVYMVELPNPTGNYTFFYQSYVKDLSQDSGFREAEYLGGGAGDDTEAQAYRIFTLLENEQDPAIIGAMNTDCGTGSTAAACNFAVSSSNLLLEYDLVDGASEPLGGGDPPADPTSTPVPATPTNTPVPPTNTPVPPTNTPAPPTSTPAPSPTLPPLDCTCPYLDEPTHCIGGSYYCHQNGDGTCQWQCGTSPL